MRDRGLVAYRPAGHQRRHPRAPAWTPRRSSSTPGLLFVPPNARNEPGHAIDAINQRFGGHAVYLGGMHSVAKLDMPDKIAFGRMPDEKVAM